MDVGGVYIHVPDGVTYMYSTVFPTGMISNRVLIN